MTRDRHGRRGNGDLKRIGAKPHAHGEEGIEARQSLPVHPDIDRVPPDTEMLGEGLYRPVAEPSERAVQQVREAAGTPRPRQEPLRRQHATDGVRGPPLPESMEILQRARRRVGKKRIVGLERVAALAAVAERNDLGDHALARTAPRTQFRERDAMDRTTANRGDAPQQRLPQLPAATAPVGQTPAAPTLGTPPAKSAVVGRQESAPGQQRQVRQIQKPGQTGQRGDERLGRRSETTHSCRRM